MSQETSPGMMALEELYRMDYLTEYPCPDATREICEIIERETRCVELAELVEQLKVVRDELKQKEGDLALQLYRANESRVELAKALENLMHYHGHAPLSPFKNEYDDISVQVARAALAAFKKGETCKQS